MRHGLTLAVLGTLFASAPMHAQVLLSDNFDAETTAIPASLLTNWNIAGTVDVVSDGGFGIRCGGMNGKCVDLDGTGMSIPGPRSISTKSSYAFLTGDRMRMSFAVSGNQRNGAVDDFFAQLVFGAETRVTTVVGSGALARPPLGEIESSLLVFETNIVGTTGFTASSLEFVARESGDVRFVFGTRSADNIGPIVDDVVIERFAASVPEPSSLALLGLGLACLLASRRGRSV